jgi:YhcH/YjgK/YiaL family protein
MIIDTLENLSKYQATIPFSHEILDFLGKNSLSALEVGKYPIEGDSVYLSIQEYTTKPENEKRWESHQKYIDIQIMISGTEYMGYTPISSLAFKDEYNETKDIIFYQDSSDNTGSAVLVPANSFAVFYPQDAHKPGYHLTTESAVKKAVIKVKNN